MLCCLPICILCIKRMKSSRQLRNDWHHVPCLFSLLIVIFSFKLYFFVSVLITYIPCLFSDVHRCIVRFPSAMNLIVASRRPQLTIRRAFAPLIKGTPSQKGVHSEPASWLRRPGRLGLVAGTFCMNILLASPYLQAPVVLVAMTSASHAEGCISFSMCCKIWNSPRHCIILQQAPCMYVFMYISKYNPSRNENIHIYIYIYITWANSLH